MDRMPSQPNFTPTHPTKPHSTYPNSRAALAMATLERAPTTSGGAARAAGGEGAASTGTPHSSSSTAASASASASTSTAAAAAAAASASSASGVAHPHHGEEHGGHSNQVFAQLRHGHVQVTMAGPARFALATPRAAIQQQQHLDAGEVVKEMRKHHTVHPLVRAGPKNGGRAKPSGETGDAGAAPTAGEDGACV